MILLFAKFGVAVGITVGIAVGIAVGFNVEVTVGVAVGFNVGVAVGTTVGIAVGFNVGVAVGTTVGVAVGFNVGVAVGTTVGVGVGSSPSNSNTSVGPCASVPLYSFDAITCSSCTCPQGKRNQIICTLLFYHIRHIERYFLIIDIVCR